MHGRLRNALERELSSARRTEASGDTRLAWSHLERAHVLSQAHAFPHLRVHWLMLRFAFRRRDCRELIGQLVRLALAAPGSWAGRAPLGNTGGANVGIFTPMPIPPDVQELLAPPAESSHASRATDV
jgi:hypothetical protein